MLFLVMLALTRISSLPIDYVAWSGPAVFPTLLSDVF